MVAGALAQIDGDLDGRDEVEFAEQREHRSAEFEPLMHRPERFDGLLKKRCRSAVGKEQGLAVLLTDARVFEVDDHRRIAAQIRLTDSEEERPAAKRRGDVTA